MKKKEIKSKIVVVYSIPQKSLSELTNDFEIIYPEGKEKFTKQELLEILPECKAAISIFTEPFDAEMIEAGRNLEIIANYGVGYNTIDIGAATKRGIRVTNSPSAVTEPTAEHVWALMLAISRRVAELDRKLRTGNVEWGVMKNLGIGLNGKVLGILGLGRIGKAVARRAHAFGLKVIYFSRHRLSGELERELNVEYREFDNLLRECDFLSINVPLTAETKHLIAADELRKMKNMAFIINTARGAVIDEKALVQALKNKEIAGAALDVFENEPFITEELKQFDNVVLSPHVGTGTYETRVEIGKEVVKNILAHFAGKTPPNIVA